MKLLIIITIMISVFVGNHPTSAEKVINLFEESQLIILGETHRIQQEYDFVQQLLLKTPEADVDLFAMELLDFRQQHLIDSFLNKPVFKRAMANEIIFRSKPDWVYKEFTELLYICWKVKQRNDNFKLIALGYKLNYHHKNPEHLGDKDSIMYKNISKYLGNHKALILVGANHAFTKFHQQTPGGRKIIRFGNLLHEKFEKIVSIRLNPIFKDCHNNFCINPLAKHPTRLFLSETDSVLASTRINNLSITGCNSITLSELYDGYFFTADIKTMNTATVDTSFYSSNRNRITGFFGQPLDSLNQYNDYIQKHGKLLDEIKSILRNVDYN